MDTFWKFTYEVLSQFFQGVEAIFAGLINGLAQMFNFPAYLKIVSRHKNDFNTMEWVLLVILLLIFVAIIVFAIVLLVHLIRRLSRARRNLADKDVVLNEVSEFDSLLREREALLGPVNGTGATEAEEVTSDAESNESEDNIDPSVRFSKLAVVDAQFKGYVMKDYKNSFTLPQLVEMFRNFAASQLGLYYTTDMMRLFIAALASTKLVILQGISGTGKTSLAYAWGKFLKHDSCVASVQPSWRDRSELFGYFNEFTKKFNETDILKELYEAGYTDDIFTVILDEMNISRVEYYFAEMLSILEMPNKDEWIVEVVSSGWPSDPIHLKNGKLKIPPNCWYIGTINNDDSTFMVTDKVYDRAMPIDINDKGQVFEPENIPAQDINYSYVNKLFEEAIAGHTMSEEVLKKIEEMDDYVIKHFRIAFGNRIVAHMKKFVPVYVACGGDEVDGVDYFIAKKILRKFEQLNVSFIRDEIDGFVAFLNKTFGENKMKECIEYVLRLKKMS